MNTINISIIGTGAQAKYIMETFSYYPDINISAIVKISGNIDVKMQKNDLTNIKIIDDFKAFKKVNVVKS